MLNGNVQMKNRNNEKKCPKIVSPYIEIDGYF